MAGVPIMYSKPHFLDVDTNIRKLLNGMNPDPKKHAGFIDIHAVKLHIIILRIFEKLKLNVILNV